MRKKTVKWTKFLQFFTGNIGFSFLKRRSNIKKHTMPGVGDALLVYAVVMFLLVYISVHTPSQWGMIGLALIEIIFLIVPVGLGCYIKTDFTRLFFIKKPNLKDVLGGLCLWIGAVILAYLIIRFIILLFPESIGKVDKVSRLPLGADSLWINLLVTVCLPAVCEELLFRGFIFRALNKKNRNLWSILITSLLFSMIHFSPLTMVYAGILGLALGYALYKTQSIFIPIIIHFINNFTDVIINYYNQHMGVKKINFISLLDPNDYDTESLFWTLVVLSLVFIMFGISLLPGKIKITQKDTC